MCATFSRPFLQHEMMSDQGVLLPSHSWTRKWTSSCLFRAQKVPKQAMLFLRIWLIGLDLDSLSHTAFPTSQISRIRLLILEFNSRFCVTRSSSIPSTHSITHPNFPKTHIALFRNRIQRICEKVGMNKEFLWKQNLYWR